MVSRLATVREDEISGVPVLWVDSGRPTLAASLVFRTGIVDETLPTSGWTHLVEHLALGGRGGGALQVNGSTSLLRTTIDAHGPADAVEAFLEDVTRWFARPSFGSVHGEREVLRAEAAQRPRGAMATTLVQRFGAQGPGLVGFDEPGLRRATPEHLLGLVRSAFTAGNAALVLDGPPRATTRLALPGGERRSVPPLPGGTGPFPAAHVLDSHVCCSGLVQRGAAAGVLADLLAGELRRELRDVAHGAYSPWSVYEPVAVDAAVVGAGSAVAPSILPRVVDLVYGSVENLRRRGPDERALTAAVEAAAQRVRDPYNALSLAHMVAGTRLEGGATLEPEEHLEQLLRLTVDDVRAAAEVCADSLVLGVPEGAVWKESMPVMGWRETRERPVGTTYRSLNAPGDRSALVVSDEVVAVGRRNRWRVVPFDEVAAVVAAPDGGREVVSDAGRSILVEPTLWRRGVAAVAKIDEAIPTALVIPHEDRPATQVPAPAGAAARWSAVPYLASVVVALAAIGAVALSVRTGNIALISFSVIGALIAVTLVATRDRTPGGGSSGP
ncbi:MAG: hypothetical protein IE926_00780 [Micrococcales bacterium]|nr:hypothetical protein [Micrococcales bacterium]